MSADDPRAPINEAVQRNREERDQERRSAAARGEEYAVPHDLGFKWSAGAPEVELYWHQFDAFLAFYLNEPDLDALGLVQLVSCYRLTLGPPGSDSPDFAKHRLWGKGLDWYGSHRVVNSTWIGPGGREIRQHYLFAFHDEMLEAVARDLVVSRWEIPMRELMQRVVAGEIGEG